MTAPTDRKLEQIRNLLALAENAATAAEAANAREKAEAAIAAYGVTDAMLAAKEGTDDHITSRIIDVPAPYAKAKVSLLGQVCDRNTVKVVVLTTGNSYGKGVQVCMVGYSRDLDRAELLFTSLSVQATRDVLNETPAGLRGKERTAWRNSWLIGFINTVSQRLARLNQQARQDADTANPGGTGAELVIRDRKTDVDAHTAELYPNTRRMSGLSSGGRGGARGREAGHRADLGQNKLGKHRAALTS